MCNAKQEFLEHIQGNGRKISCATISYQHEGIELRRYYTPSEYENFLHHLDFDYDDGYGTQYLFGVIWYTDGTWSERFEYDGAERWIHQVCPPIPDRL